MKSLAFASINQLKKKLAEKEISSQELLSYFINRFKKYDGQLGAALEIFDASSIINVSEKQGVLTGIPGITKDNICQRDRITSCASKILSNFRSTYDSTAVMRLKKAGALMIGRANCDEFAMGSSGEYSSIKRTANPWDISRVAGGSSSGPIASVAAGLIPWALGSETGGSVRLPAAFCGVIGLKPTYGAVSRYGLVAYGSSLDQIGVATRNVFDNALLFSVIAGNDPKDSSSHALLPKDYTLSLDGQLPKGIKIGVIENMINAEGIDPEISKALDNAIKKYEKIGATISRISLPSLDYGAAVYFIVSRAELASNLARFDGVRYGKRVSDETLIKMYEKTRHDGFGAEVRMRIIVGNYVLSTGHADKFYEKAQQVQNLMRAEFDQAFAKVDLLFAPVHAMTAFKFGAMTNKLQMDLQDYFTCPANLAGIPAISVPCGFSNEKLPISFQLIGPKFSEQTLFNVAHAYEQENEWYTMVPPGFE